MTCTHQAIALCLRGIGGLNDLHEDSDSQWRLGCLASRRRFSKSWRDSSPAYLPVERARAECTACYRICTQ